MGRYVSWRQWILRKLHSLDPETRKWLIMILLVLFLAWDPFGWMLSYLVPFLLAVLTTLGLLPTDSFESFPGVVKQFMRWINEMKWTTSSGTTFHFASLAILVYGLLNLLQQVTLAYGLIACIIPAIYIFRLQGFNFKGAKAVLLVLIYALGNVFAFTHFINISLYNVFVWWNINFHLQVGENIPLRFAGHYRQAMELFKNPIVVVSAILLDSPFTWRLVSNFWGGTLAATIMWVSAFLVSPYYRACWIAKAIFLPVPAIPFLLAFLIFISSSRVSVALAILAAKMLIISSSNIVIFVLFVLGLLWLTTISLYLASNAKNPPQPNIESKTSNGVPCYEFFAPLQPTPTTPFRLQAIGFHHYIELPVDVIFELVQTGNHWGFAISAADGSNGIKFFDKTEKVVRYLICHYAGGKRRLFAFTDDDCAVKFFSKRIRYTKRVKMRCSLSPYQVAAMCRVFNSDIRRTTWADTFRVFYQSNCALFSYRILQTCGGSLYSYLFDLARNITRNPNPKWQILMFLVADVASTLQWVWDDFEEYLLPPSIPPWIPDTKADLASVATHIHKHLSAACHYIHSILLKSA